MHLVSARIRTHTQFRPAPNLAFFLPLHVSSLNCTADSGSFCYFSVTSLRFICHSRSFTKGQLCLPVTCPSERIPEAQHHFSICMASLSLCSAELPEHWRNLVVRHFDCFLSTVITLIHHSPFTFPWVCLRSLYVTSRQLLRVAFGKSGVLTVRLANRKFGQFHWDSHSTEYLCNTYERSPSGPWDLAWGYVCAEWEEGL
jgi:hypothetical protein